MPSTHKHIYIVDDEPSVRKGVSALLHAANYDVETFASAEDFLAHARNHEPSGVLLADVRMPGLDGMGLLTALREDDVKIPVILMTALADVPLAVKAMQKGASDFLEKPFDRETLLKALDRLDAPAPAPAATKSVPECGYASRYQTLSEREKQVFAGIVSGTSNKALARELGISPRTVEVHRAHVMTKMGADHFSQLVQMAVSLQLLNPD